MRLLAPPPSTFSSFRFTPLHPARLRKFFVPASNHRVFLCHGKQSLEELLLFLETLSYDFQLLKETPHLAHPMDLLATSQASPDDAFSGIFSLGIMFPLENGSVQLETWRIAVGASVPMSLVTNPCSGACS